MFNFKVLDKIAFSIVIAMCRFSKGCDSAKLQITSIISCKGQPFYTLQYTKIIRLQNTTILYTIMCKIFLHLVGWLSVYAMVHISCYSYVYMRYDGYCKHCSATTSSCGINATNIKYT